MISLNVPLIAIAIIADQIVRHFPTMAFILSGIFGHFFFNM